jgi:hypothetical protein
MPLGKGEDDSVNIARCCTGGSHSLSFIGLDCGQLPGFGVVMESPVHSLPSLFKQLGLPDDALSIERFVAVHSPLKAELKLEDAFFWTDSQQAFLREEILEDADWAQVMDELNLLLRAGRDIPAG